MTLGENVKRLRKNKKITQQELADSAGVHRSTIAYTEQGRSIPKSYTLRAIARALRVKVDILLLEEPG